MKKLLFAISFCALCASVSPLPGYAETPYGYDDNPTDISNPSIQEAVPAADSQAGAVRLREAGREAFKKKDYAAAVKYYRQAAEMGDAEAQFLLGNRYYNGQGVNTDRAKALYCYEHAARQGYAEAQVLLGQCYLYGDGLTKDERKGIHWLNQAVEHGSSFAKLVLGLCYINGTGVAADPKHGLSLVRSAAEQGDAIAQLCLGHFYCEGTGIGTNITEGKKWLQKACTNEGEKNKNNADFAKEILRALRDIEEHGSNFAKIALGLCYINGTGVAADPKHGFSLVQSAAEHGNASAQLGLGCLYCEGTGVEANITEGKKWLAMAATSQEENTKDTAANAKEILSELNNIEDALAEAEEIKCLQQDYLQEQKSEDKETISAIRKSIESTYNWIDSLRKSQQNTPTLIIAANNGDEQAAKYLKDMRQEIESFRNANKKQLNFFRSEATGEIRVPAEIYTNTKQYDNLKPYDAFTRAKQACGYGDPKSYALLESSARRGCNQAKICLAYSLLPAKHKLNKGNWDSFVFEGKELSEAERLQRYLKWMGSAADNGSLTACQELRQVYKEGTYAPKDSAKVFHYTKAAAQLKDPDAMFDLGTRYAAGIGCQKDRAAAVKWIKQAAHAGNADAQQWIDDRRGRYVENTQSYRINPYQAFQEALRKYPQAYSVTEFYHSSGRTSSDLCIGIVNGERDGYTDVVDTPDISHVPGRYVLIPGRCRWNRGDIVMFYGYSTNGTDGVKLIDDCTRTRTVRKWQGPKIGGWEDLLK